MDPDAPTVGRHTSGSSAAWRRCFALARFSPKEAYSAVKPSTLAEERWFRHKLVDVTEFEVVDYAHLESGRSSGESLILGILRFEGAGDYFVPLVIAEDAGLEGLRSERCVSSRAGAHCAKAYCVVEGESGRKRAALYDGAFHPGYINTVLDLIESDATVRSQRGQFRFRKVGGGSSERGWRIDKVGDAYTNSVVIAERRSAFKTFRLMSPGINPDVEVGVMLATMTGFHETARVQGEVSYVDSLGVEYSVGVQTEEVPNIGDAWELVGVALENVTKAVGTGRRAEGIERLNTDPILSSDASWRLGGTVGRLHQALASIRASGFGIREAGVGDVEMWRRNAKSRALRALSDIRDALSSSPGSTDAASLARLILNEKEAVLAAVGGASWGRAPDPGGVGMVMRCHGDLHLGQILVGPDGSYAILDFEGEPLASVEERRALTSPARDVAGMMRSYSYAANAAFISAQTSGKEEYLGEVGGLLEGWESRTRKAFLEGYYHEASCGPRALVPEDAGARNALVSYFELEKALYEVSYELNNRPSWAIIPLKGIARIIGNLGGGRL